MRKVMIYEEEEIKNMYAKLENISTCLSCINLNGKDSLTLACNPNFLNESKNIVNELKKDLQYNKSLDEFIKEVNNIGTMEGN